MVTRWEVQDAVWASGIEPAGKFILVAILSRATGDSLVVEGRYAPTFDELASMTGYSRSTISDWMKALAAAGWYGRDGGATRSAGGYVLAIGASEVRLPKRVRRPKGDGISPVTGPKPEALDAVAIAPIDAPTVRQPDQKAPQSATEADPIGPVTGPDKSGSQTKASPVAGPKPEAPIRNLPTGDAVPPSSPSSPSPGVAPVNDEHPSTATWVAADRQSKATVTPTNRAQKSRQAPLISAKGLKLTEAQEIIQGWGRLNNYADATDNDIRAVHRLVQTAFPGKASVPYLRGIAKPEGSGFGAFFEQVRKERAQQAEAEIRALELAHPECEHGTPAGVQLHPIHGTPLCPMCRRGVPVQEAKAGTHPDIVAAITAYRDAFDGPLMTTEVVMLTQQATAFHAEGATRSQLVALAKCAAERGQTLFVAATREDA